MCRWRVFRNVMNVQRFVNSFYSSNTYILSLNSDDYAWIIDVGDAWNIIDWLNNSGKKIKGVLLTHTHFDHIYGLNDLLDYDPCLRVYTCENGRDGLLSDKFNLSKYHEQSFVFKGKDNIFLLNNSIIELWPGVVGYIYKTPGHDWSCLTYDIGDFLFTGDSYIPGQDVVTVFPKSNKKDAIKSLAKIHEFLTRNYTICPGHGDMTKAIDIKSINVNNI